MRTFSFKRALLLTGLACGSLTFAACEKYLNLTSPNELTGPDNFSTPAKVDGFLLQAYNQLQGGDLFGGQLQVLSELYGDNLDFNAIQGSTGDATFRTRQYDIFANPANNTWTNAYKAIDNCNLVIRAVDENLFEADQAVKDRIKGEALFIRGVCHFELVRLFAKPYSNSPGTDPGVVLRLKSLSANEVVGKVGRSRVGEVYAAVLNDLSDAARLLPAQNPDRATSSAAKAYLARVYFEQNDYANAAASATDVIANGGFSLDTPPNSVTGPFTQSGPGQKFSSVIFQMVNTVSDDGASGLRSAFFNAFGTPRLSLNNRGTVDASGNGDLAEALRERGGLRYDSLVVHVEDNSDPNNVVIIDFSNKYRGSEITGSTPINIPVIRLQEMLLTRAEARAELNAPDAEVRADLNAVRVAAGRPADNTISGKQNLLNAVRYERRIELFLEGDRFHQLRRLRQPSRGFAFNSGRLLPIPQDEVNGNPGIEQNGE